MKEDGKPSVHKAVLTLSILLSSSSLFSFTVFPFSSDVAVCVVVLHLTTTKALIIRDLENALHETQMPMARCN